MFITNIITQTHALYTLVYTELLYLGNIIILKEFSVYGAAEHAYATNIFCLTR